MYGPHDPHHHSYRRRTTAMTTLPTSGPRLAAPPEALDEDLGAGDITSLLACRSILDVLAVLVAEGKLGRRSR